MTKTINMLELRSKIGEVIDRTYYNKDYFLVRRNQRKMAIIMPVVDYQLFFSDKDIDTYSNDEIKEFEQLDKISPALRKKVAKIIKSSKKYSS